MEQYSSCSRKDRLRAVFVNLSRDLYDQHGVYALAGTLKHHGISVGYVSEPSCPRTLARLRELEPDLLLYSSFSNSLHWYAQFDQLAKQLFPSVVSVIGGPGPTYSPASLTDSSINALCIGEGDHALIGFIENGFASYGNIRTIKAQGPCPDLLPLAQLDKLPFPDREPVYRADRLLRDMPAKQFFSGRGCPYGCTYCFNHSFREMFRNSGPPVRKKSVDYVLEEIRQVRAAYGLASVVFNDDLFIVNKRWLMEFCERFPSEINLPYTCNVRANLVDEDVVRALRDSGCRAVNWSIESGDANIRDKILQRHMSDEQILRAGELMNRYSIKHRIGNLVGLPGETREQMLLTLELNIRTKPNLGVANIFVPYPGLRITEFAVSHGHYTPQAESHLPRTFYERSVLNISPEMNLWLQKLMWLFSLFVRYPILYRTRWLRDLCFHLPCPLLRIIREVVYTRGMMDLYIVKTPINHKMRLAWRYVQSLLWAE